jgi:hypothetical protein
MPKNVLIGIGGTGSRVIESVVNLCAAGMGPEKLHIFMIDPDQGNGNLTRTKSLITRYRQLRALYERTAGNPSFKTEIIIPPADEPFIWSIFEERNYTLGKYINYNNLKKTAPELADLANVLFTNDELDTDLERGFRGHPSIGSVVMADPPMDRYPFKLLWDGIETLGENELKVFIVGSIFGGTGAAGFPTLGSQQLLKYNDAMHAKLADGKSRILLGGALVLPYFSFTANPDIQESMFVTNSDFPIATKAALQYYNDKQLGFDQYYFIGDSLSQNVGKFSTGSAEQENKPHYIEVSSALAAFDFFSQSATAAKEAKFFIASRENEKVDWNSLPVTRDSSNLQTATRQFRDLLADFTIFAYTWLTFGKNTLAKTHKQTSDETWYAENFKKEFKEASALYNPRHQSNNELYTHAEDFLNRFLYWICSLDDRDKVQLIDQDKILAAPIPADKKLSLRDPEAFKANIGAIIRNKTGTASYDFNKFRTAGLEESVIKDGTISAGSRYLDIFYSASSKFNRKNLM